MTMKNIAFPLLLLILAVGPAPGQDVNWASGARDKNLLSASFGADYSSYYSISYGRLLQIGKKSLVAGTVFTLPFGSDLTDDWRLLASVQTELLRHGSFALTLKPALVLRQYESPMAALFNVGADVSALYGYQKPGWGAAVLLSYDRSISARITHRLQKDDYPAVRDGWYRTRSGNFRFGARLNYTRRSWGMFLTIGKHYGQNFRDNPTFPFFAELTLQKRF